MKKRIASIGVVVLLVASMPTAADMFSPSHSCRKPYKPYEFEDTWQVEQFRSEVERYEGCIEDFVEDQNEAAQRHRDAAEEAIEEWNRFVRVELN